MSINYLTPTGFERIKNELKELLETQRPSIVKSVNEAAAMGDRSENAEYIYGKKRLREIDRRIGFLQKRLDNFEIVDPAKIDISKVSFGAWVRIQSDEGQAVAYQIVGEDEIEPSAGRITFSSPVGRALLGKRVGDLVTVRRPAGDVEFEVIEISRKAFKT